MRDLVLFLFVSVALLGCGGGGGGNSSTPPLSSVNEYPGSIDNNFNDGLTGKLYYNGIYHYRELKLATGQIHDLHGINLHGVSMPNRDATVFVQDYNEAASGEYTNEDIVFFYSDSQEIGRTEINCHIGEVRLSPDGQYVLFPWFGKNYDSGQLVVMERYGKWERHFGIVNSRAYDWSSDGKVFFSYNKEIFLVENISTGEPVKVAATPGFVYDLNVSPDGTKFAFSGSPGSEKKGHIYT